MNINTKLMSDSSFEEIKKKLETESQLNKISDESHIHESFYKDFQNTFESQTELRQV